MKKHAVTPKKRTVKPALCGRHYRVWENKHGVAVWADELKSRREAQALGQALLESEGATLGSREYWATGVIVSKLAPKRWQAIAFAADQGLEL